VIYEDRDPYNLAVECNQDEDTYAPMDLFDWLDIIARLKDDYTQEEIGEKIGWSRSKVCDYSNLLNNIDAQVLDIARKHQKDRATKKVAHATFNFTEYWFRTSGIYDLNKDNQLKLMNWFIDNKCNVNKKKQATLNLNKPYNDPHKTQRIKKLMRYADKQKLLPCTACIKL
jgi:hypothetical protein